MAASGWYWRLLTTGQRHVDGRPFVNSRGRFGCPSWSYSLHLLPSRTLLLGTVWVVVPNWGVELALMTRAAPGARSSLSRQSVSGSDGAADNQNSTSGVTSRVDPGACVWKALPSQPAAGSALWEGNDPAAGDVEYTNCLSTGGTQVAPFRYVANAAAPGAAPAPPPPPDPAVLAQQAFQQIPIPKPDIHLGPNPDLVAVNIPVWLWVSTSRRWLRSPLRRAESGDGHTGFDVGVVVNGRTR